MSSMQSNTTRFTMMQENIIHIQKKNRFIEMDPEMIAVVELAKTFK